MSFEELEQDPFDTHEFVERIAWRTMGTKAKSQHEEFDPMILHGAFERMIADLKQKNDLVQQRVDKLEEECKEEEKKLWTKVMDQQKNNQASFSHFQSLDERINLVATKVVHLGDQLEGVNTPRARAVEAKRLMSYLSEFLTDEPPKSAIFTDPFQLQIAAEIIQKLHMIALELPSSDRKFVVARQKIADKYDQIENELIEEFRIAHHAGDKRKMKRCASVLSNFKGHGKCIDTFIEEAQKNAFMSSDPFNEVLPLCTKTNELIQEVFSNPDVVMGKLVQNIYLTKLQTFIKSKLDKQDDPEQYLKDFFDIYTRTTKLSSDLSDFKIGNDSSFLPKLSKIIFQKHLDDYINFETRYLHERCGAILQRYYDSKEHQKKQIQSGGLSEFRRDLQAKIANVNVNINIGPSVENYGGETFLSQEVSINILQETKLAFKRCEMLSGSSDVATNAVKILDVLIRYLVTEHIDYSIEIGLQGIPVSEPKTEPQIYFFDIVSQANTLFHLFEKQFMDNAVPLFMSTPLYAECLHKKRNLRETLEGKIDTGLDRAVVSICGWVKSILSNEQKKNDFKPDDDSVLAQMGTPLMERKESSDPELNEILIAGSTYIWIILLSFCFVCAQAYVHRKATGYCDDEFSMKSCEGRTPAWIDRKWISTLCFLFLMIFCTCSAESKSEIYSSRMGSVQGNHRKLSTGNMGLYQELWRISLIILIVSFCYIYCLYRNSQARSNKRDEMNAWSLEDLSDKDQTSAEMSNKQSRGNCSDNDQEVDIKMESKLAQTLHLLPQELGIKEDRSEDNLPSVAGADEPEKCSEDLNATIEVHPGCDKAADHTKGKEFSTPILEDRYFPVTSHGQRDVCGIQVDKDQNESLTTDEATENINNTLNEDLGTRSLFSCYQKLGINKNRSGDNLSSIAQAENPKDGTEDFGGVTMAHSACDIPAHNTEAKENKFSIHKCTCEDSNTCGQYERDDASGMWDGGDPRESLITDEATENLNRCKEHERLNDNKIVDHKNGSTDDSLDGTAIENDGFERREIEKTLYGGDFDRQELISQREEPQISNGIQKFMSIYTIFKKPEKSNNAAFGECSGFNRLHGESNDHHLLQFNILHHKPIKSVDIEVNSTGTEDLQDWDSVSLERKSSYEREKKGKYTYLDKVLPAPQLEINVFKNESVKFFEPVLDIVTLIADGNDPGPQVTMQYELLRICTLRNYPKDNKPFLIQFAKAGFYYAAEGDEVICYCCGLRRHSWLATDVPYRIHQRINPNCKFLNRNPEFNVPVVYTGTTKNLDKLDILLIRLEEENKSPQATTDAEGGNDLSEYVPPQALSGTLNNPKHRQYISKAQRLSSYEGWPDNLIQTPEIMAEAGFYYAGFGDCVRCYYCGIGLRHWTAEDNVWIEHARWSKHCAFLKQEKGQEFINLVHMAIKYTQDDDEQPVIEASNPDDKESPENGFSEQGLVDKILLTDPAQSVLEMGYTPKIIKKAIAFILNRDGRSGISSQTIMEKVLEFEEAENAKTLAGELANMDLGRQDNSTGGPNSGSSRKSIQKSTLSKTSKSSKEDTKTVISYKDSRSKSIKEENEKLKGQTLCRVCTTNTVCIVLLPCGHLCACDECGSALRTCPICQKDVKGTVKTYMS